MTIMSSRSHQSLGTTHCSRGHVHPPWNTTGILRIAKCESVCGFCQKETKTAANLRKHVAIHIKNEGLSLTIAEGSSGRGRLEMPPSELERRSSTPSISNTTSPATSFSASAVLLSISHPASYTQPAFTNPIYNAHSVSTSTNSTPSPVPSVSHLSHPLPYTAHLLGYPSYNPSSSSSSSSSATTPTLGDPTPHHLLQRYHPLPLPSSTTAPSSSSSSSSHHHHHQHHQQHRHLPPPPPLQQDLFHRLRSHNLATKTAWTAIPSSEGARILEMCKINSQVDLSEQSYYDRYPGAAVASEVDVKIQAQAQAQASSSTSASSRKSSLVVTSPTIATSSSSSSPHGHVRRSSTTHQEDDPSSSTSSSLQSEMQIIGRTIPCYNRKILYDEEWQAHMRDVHGVFLLWPDMWMKRVEVLDLDPFGGDIGVCNDVIMDG